MKRLYVDYDKCVGCELCAMSCSLEKTGRVNPAESRIHVVRVEEDGVMMPAVCRHCDEPYCIPVCPVNCITKDAVTGLVSIDEAACIGCKKCVQACPYEGPVTIPVTGRKQKNIKALCDICGGNPVCVTVCPTEALQFVELNRTMLKKKRSGEARLKELLRTLA